MRLILNIVLCASIFVGCQPKSDDIIRIVDDSDLKTFWKIDLQKEFIGAQEELEFWLQKASKNSNGHIYLQQAAKASIKLYRVTGKAKYLNLNKTLLEKANGLVQGNHKVNNLLLLSHSEMMLHNFESAVNYAVKAASLTKEKYGPLLMQFDGELELANYNACKRLLEKTKRDDSFSYFVRIAKFKDHEGHLDSAIYYTEKAIKHVTSPSERNWLLSHLGDLYGHDGMINKSYETYLKSLSFDANNHHTLKGIAWIAFSHDKNFDLAKRLSEYLVSNYGNPEYLLLLADIEETMGNLKRAELHREHFISKAKSPIYNSYLIPLLASNDAKEAIRIATTEIHRRPTPEIFSLLAWAYFNDDQKKKALEIIESEVLGKTYEPMALYQAAEIYYGSGYHSKGVAIAKNLMESEFELGPLVINRIRIISES
ncbi:tetratricopeptide repeat protein [Ekhidna sp.]|uniref:tetratricopeptide repeat protein n=1 Tax=Ekhidna sp. TaxID=2608089 RepID=UPI003B5119BF